MVADDGGLSSSPAVSTISIVPINDLPIAENDAITGAESDTNAAFNVFANNGVDVDSDPDGDVFNITRIASGNDETVLAGTADGTGVGTAIAGSDGGLFTVNADGTANFDANDEFDDLALGETRTTEIVYQIDDGNGGTDTAVVTYTVAGVNDRPVIDLNSTADDPHVCATTGSTQSVTFSNFSGLTYNNPAVSGTLSVGDFDLTVQGEASLRASGSVFGHSLSNGLAIVDFDNATESNVVTFTTSVAVTSVTFDLWSLQNGSNAPIPQILESLIASEGTWSGPSIQVVPVTGEIGTEALIADPTAVNIVGDLNPANNIVLTFDAPVTSFTLSVEDLEDTGGDNAFVAIDSLRFDIAAVVPEVCNDPALNYMGVFTEDGGPVPITDPILADTGDQEDNITTLTIAPSGIVDGTAEVITFNGDSGSSVSLPADGSNTNQQSLTIGGTDVVIAFNPTSGVIEITEQLSLIHI